MNRELKKQLQKIVDEHNLSGIDELERIAKSVLIDEKRLPGDSTSTYYWRVANIVRDLYFGTHYYPTPEEIKYS